MTWIVVGDSEKATFACDTSMTSFGPLHTESGALDARRELEKFADTLHADPRRLDRQDLLVDKYLAWRSDRDEFTHKFEVGDYAIDETEPTPSPEVNTVQIVELVDKRASELVIDETGQTVAEHNPYYPDDDPVVAGVYPHMGGTDKVFHFPESRLRKS
jgi:hypothetical protein